MKPKTTKIKLIIGLFLFTNLIFAQTSFTINNENEIEEKIKKTFNIDDEIHISNVLNPQNHNEDGLYSVYTHYHLKDKYFFKEGNIIECFTQLPKDSNVIFQKVLKLEVSKNEMKIYLKKVYKLYKSNIDHEEYLSLKTPVVIPKNTSIEEWKKQRKKAEKMELKEIKRNFKSAYKNILKGID
ncbi:hypothetical protein [Aureivirga sp. CE67]|uniref:hypothetical protein n=1 Tax=Aureivirga sp. CE67 TaxID=1788983 RepID=UPI0018C9DB74|nr:hypothetical protein [Aureivirga sp. CE67]